MWSPYLRIAGGFGLALALAACGPAEPHFRNLGPEASYVGFDECRHCHLEIASTHAATGMGRAWHRMSPDVAVEDFRDHNEVEIPATGLRYRMTERDGRYFMRQFRRDSGDAEMVADERELVWVIGSNNHSRSYAAVEDGRLFQAPLCWYPDATLWDLCPGFEFENKHFSRGITDSCAYCHNGHMRAVEGTRFRFEEPFPHGIDCERCHGPGSLHVAKWESDDHTPTGKIDETIVNPARLPPQTRLDVCLQCHLGDSKATERVRRSGRSPRDYRPGMPLTEVIQPFRYIEPTGHDFGISAQADRMLRSRCFTESGGRLECLTCHNPHVTVYLEGRPRDLFRRRCLRCHAQEDCSGETHARAETAGLADDCVACHMRKAGPDDQLHTEVTDHWIRRTPDVERRPRGSLAIEPIFPDALSALSPGEQAFLRARANLLLSVKTGDPRRRSMWEEAERTLREAIDTGEDNADSRFFLGQALGYLGRPAEAEAEYRAVLRHDPGHYDAAFGVGQSLGEQGRTQEALAQFRAMRERFPDDPGVLGETGRFSILLGAVEEGLELCARAAELEPWTASLQLNRGMGLASLGRFDEAVAAAEAAARIDPDDPEIWEFYARVMQAAGRPGDAGEARRVLRRLRSGRATAREAH